MSNSTVTITGPRTPYEKANEAKRKGENTSENIQVFVRCRPLDTSRNEKRGVVEIDRLRKEIRVNERLNSAAEKQSRLFTYDGVFDSSIGQCEVYDHVVSPLIDEVLAGYNCTVFAYGQTGTGKTYTMEGERSDFECSWQDDPKAGIVPRALDQLFETLSESQGSSQVAVSYMELYNEKLYDLLNPTDDLASLSIYEEKGGKVRIGRLAQVSVTKKDEIFEILQKGSAKRQKAATKLNACSSRSHTIFTVTIRSKDPDALLSGEEVYRIGKLNLVDLAGSENIGRSGAIEKRAAEAGNINKSLLTLGRVITSLVERQNHIPYRESKLTRLLQDSLGGGTKTSIIATISPNILDVEDTLSTLDYAQRAKKIQNKPEVNQKVAKNDILRDVEEELLKCRRDLEAARCGTNAFVISKENYDTMTTTIDSLGKGVEEKQAKIAEYESLIADLENEKASITKLFGQTKQKLEEETEKRIQTEATLENTEKDLKVTTQDRNEQKHLVEVHVKTEEVLKSQADQLLQVAQVSTDHVGKLHEKVARVHDLQEETVSKVKNTCNSINSRLDLLQNIVSEKFDKRNLDIIDTIVEKKFEEIISSLNTVSSQTEKYTESVTAGIVELSKSSDSQEVIEQFKTVIISTENLERIRNELRSELIQAVQENKSQSQVLLNSFNESFSNQRNAIEELLMSLSQQLTQSNRDVSKELASLESVMVNILKTKSQEVEAKSSEVQTANKQMFDLHTSRMEHIAQIKEIIHQMETSESTSTPLVTSSLDSVSNGLLLSSQELHNQSKKVGTMVSEVNRNVEQSRKTCSKIVDQLDNALARDHQSNVDMVINASSQVNSQTDSLLATVDEIHAKASEKCAELVTFEKSVLSQFESTFEATKNSLEDLAAKVTEQAQPLNDQVEAVSQLISESRESIENEVYSTKLFLDSAQKNVSKELKSLDEQFVSLASNELKRYQPTGETPQKTCFDFPTNLTATSPHERILERFRAHDPNQTALSVMATLHEGSGLSSSNESIESCGTASSSGSNLENKIPTGNTSKVPKLKSKGTSEIARAVKKKEVLQSLN